MRKHWLHGFHFTRNERYGVQVVLFLSILCFALPSLVGYFSKEPQTDFSALEAQLALLRTEENKPELVEKSEFDFNPNTASFDDFVALGLSERISNRILNYRDKGGTFFDADDFGKIYGLPPSDFQRLSPFVRIEGKKRYSQQAKPWEKKEAAQKRTITLQDFDPNTASFDEFCNLGLSERTAHSILNYREKGGSFRHKSDLQKIYTLEKSEFQRLYAYIDLPEKQLAEAGPNTYSTSSTFQKKNYKEKAQNKPVPIDINTAEQADWEQLQGIGPYFAKKIVAYREKLGGFADLRQVAETYNLPDSVYQNIEPWLQISPINRPININKATVSELSMHPYISTKQAKIIIAYRDQHGNFGAAEELLNIKILDEAWLTKVGPYLAIE